MNQFYPDNYHKTENNDIERNMWIEGNQKLESNQKLEGNYNLKGVIDTNGTGYNFLDNELLLQNSLTNKTDNNSFETNDSSYSNPFLEYDLKHYDYMDPEMNEHKPVNEGSDMIINHSNHKQIETEIFNNNQSKIHFMTEELKEKEKLVYEYKINNTK